MASGRAAHCPCFRLLLVVWLAQGTRIEHFLCLLAVLCFHSSFHHSFDLSTDCVLSLGGAVLRAVLGWGHGRAIYTQSCQARELLRGRPYSRLIRTRPDLVLPTFSGLPPPPPAAAAQGASKGEGLEVAPPLVVNRAAAAAGGPIELEPVLVPPPPQVS